MMDELYNKYYKMMYGADAPYVYGGYTYYHTPQKYGIDMSEDGRPLYAVPNDQVGVRGMFNRMFDPEARHYAEVMERNAMMADALTNKEQYIDYNNVGNNNMAYAAERYRGE